MKRLITNPEQARQLRTAIRAGMAAGGGTLPLKVLRRSCRIAEDIPAVQIEQGATVEYRGYTVQIFKRLDVSGPYQFQPVILKDGVEVHQVFVRSKTERVSMEHFGKRAVDAFLKFGMAAYAAHLKASEATGPQWESLPRDEKDKWGKWPVKEGLTV